MLKKLVKQYLLKTIGLKEKWRDLKFIRSPKEISHYAADKEELKFFSSDLSEDSNNSNIIFQIIDYDNTESISVQNDTPVT